MPPFAPLFSEAGESEFIDKLMVVVNRDLKPALDYFYLADALPALAAMTRGELSVFTYPLLVLGLEQMHSEETESGEWLHQELVVGAGLVVEDTTVAGAQRKLEKYVRAFKAVVRKGVLELLPSVSASVGYELVIDHQYLRHGTKGEQIVQPVEFKIRIEYGEK